MPYDELVKRLRDNEHEIDCSLCDRDCCYPDGKVHGKCIIIEAADAIEEMSRLHEAQRQNLITLMNEEPEPKWVPVTERLPRMWEEVMLRFPNNQAVGFHDGDSGWAVFSGDNMYTYVAPEEVHPTHWKPKEGE